MIDRRKLLRNDRVAYFPLQAIIRNSSQPIGRGCSTFSFGNGVDGARARADNSVRVELSIEQHRSGCWRTSGSEEKRNGRVRFGKGSRKVGPRARELSHSHIHTHTHTQSHSVIDSKVVSLDRKNQHSPWRKSLHRDHYVNTVLAGYLKWQSHVRDIIFLYVLKITVQFLLLLFINLTNFNFINVPWQSNLFFQEFSWHFRGGIFEMTVTCKRYYFYACFRNNCAIFVLIWLFLISLMYYDNRTFVFKNSVDIFAAGYLKWQSRVGNIIFTHDL